MAVLEHLDQVCDLAISKDGKRIATASLDGTARIWSIETGQLVLPPLLHGPWVTSVAFSADGRRLLTACMNGGARIWNALTGQPSDFRMLHRGDTWRAAFSPEGRRVVTASNDGSAQVWDIANCQQTHRESAHPSWVAWMRFDADGKRLLVRCWGGQQPVRTRLARVWDPVTGKPLAPPITWPRQGINDVVFAPDGRRVLAACGDKGLRWWDSDNGSLISTLIVPTQETAGLFLSPDGRHVVTTYFNGDTAHIRDLSDGKPVGLPLKHNDHLNVVTFSANGRVAASTGSDKAVRVWESPSGKPIASLIHDHAVYHPALNGDSSLLVVTGADDTAHVWETNTQTRRFRLTHGNNHVLWADFNHSGTMIVTTGLDGTARLWDSSTGRPVAPPLTHRGDVMYAAFSPDDRIVVTCSRDKTARLWDSQTGLPLSPSLVHDSQVYKAVFSRDGQWLATGGGEPLGAGEMRVWDLSPDSHSVTERMRVAQILHGRRLDPFNALVPLSAAEFDSAWQLARAAHPHDFGVTAAHARAWHRRQRDVCLREKNAWGAIFHALHANPESVIYSGWLWR